MNLLSVKNLSVGYATASGCVQTVKNVSFDVPEGAFVGIAGESGSGKSTLAKAIMRILQPPGLITAGAVELEGRDLLQMNAAALREIRWRKVAMVFQSALDSLNPVLTIRAQFDDLGGGSGNGLDFERLAELLGYVDLPNDVLGAYPHQLSGGMRQRVGIALALFYQPKLLILDEPTTALDVVVQRHILMVLRSLQSRFGFSILFITHDLPVLLAMSDEVLIMKDGHLCEMASPDALRRAPKHPYTRQLLDAVDLLHKDDESEGRP